MLVLCCIIFWSILSIFVVVFLISLIFDGRDIFGRRENIGVRLECADILQRMYASRKDAKAYNECKRDLLVAIAILERSKSRKDRKLANFFLENINSFDNIVR